MSKYNSDNKFKISSNGKDSGILIYNLYQDGWDKGKPRMVNDITIQINGYNTSSKHIYEIAKFIKDQNKQINIRVQILIRFIMMK